MWLKLTDKTNGETFLLPEREIQRVDEDGSCGSLIITKFHDDGTATGYDAIESPSEIAAMLGAGGSDGCRDALTKIHDTARIAAEMSRQKKLTTYLDKWMYEIEACAAEALSR